MLSRLSDLEMEAWQALLHAHHEIVGKLDAELAAEHGLGMSDYDVLLRLVNARGGQLRMSDLAARVMISASALTRAVDRLEKRGLVRRERDREDARGSYAKLTEEGQRRLRAAARTHLRGIREHFTRHLTEEQLRDVASALQAIAGPHIPH